MAELRALLSERRDPAPALSRLRKLGVGGLGYHEAVTRLLRSKEREPTRRDATLAYVLIAESGGNILRAWHRIEREIAEIERLWMETGADSSRSN
jgi:hypothetical protein